MELVGLGMDLDLLLITGIKKLAILRPQQNNQIQILVIILDMDQC